MEIQGITSKVRQMTQLSALSLVGGLALAGCSFNVSTAALDNLQTCTEVASDNLCASDVTEFQKDTPELFATADLKYAPEGTVVTIDWNYLGGEAGDATAIDSLTLETESDTTVITSSLPSPEQGWPAGDYEVVFSLDTDNSEPVSKQFSVVAP